MAELFNTHQKDRKTKTEIFISGGGEMGELIRSFDWTKTSLGPISQWPLSLRTAVNLILQSTAPLVILWGREGITIYNNAYISFAGLRHPSLLGASCEKIWPEAAEFICNVIKKCHEGESLSYKKFPYTVYRNDIPEDIWMDLDCSPILNDEGEPAGVFIVNIETTDQVRAEQRQRNAEERYDLAMGAAELIGTWDWHIKPDKFYADFRLASLFGIDPEEFKQGLSISEYFSAIHPEDKERVSNAVNLAMKKKRKVFGGVSGDSEGWKYTMDHCKRSMHL